MCSCTSLPHTRLHRTYATFHCSAHSDTSIGHCHAKTGMYMDPRELALNRRKFSAPPAPLKQKLQPTGRAYLTSGICSAAPLCGFEPLRARRGLHIGPYNAKLDGTVKIVQKATEKLPRNTCVNQYPSPSPWKFTFVAVLSAVTVMCVAKLLLPLCAAERYIYVLLPSRWTRWWRRRTTHLSDAAQGENLRPA